MALVGQAPYDALGAQATEQGPASTMESNPTNRTLGAYTGYYRELLSFLTAQLRCPHEAADLVQETFARLLALDNPDVVRQPRAFSIALPATSPSTRAGKFPSAIVS